MGFHPTTGARNLSGQTNNNKNITDRHNLGPFTATDNTILISPGLCPQFFHPEENYTKKEHLTSTWSNDWASEKGLFCS
jgi:hypothetical protein